MQSITGWIVQTARGIHGPFVNASEAGTYIEAHHQNLAAPFSVMPMHEPRVLRRSIQDVLREIQATGPTHANVPFDDGWSPST